MEPEKKQLEEEGNAEGLSQGHQGPWWQEWSAGLDLSKSARRIIKKLFFGFDKRVTGLCAESSFNERGQKSGHIRQKNHWEVSRWRLCFQNVCEGWVREIAVWRPRVKEILSFPLKCVYRLKGSKEGQVVEQSPRNNGRRWIQRQMGSTWEDLRRKDEDGCFYTKPSFDGFVLGMGRGVETGSKLDNFRWHLSCSRVRVIMLTSFGKRNAKCSKYVFFYYNHLCWCKPQLFFPFLNTANSNTCSLCLENGAEK